MARPNDILDELNALFQDETIDDVVVLPSGEIYFGNEAARRPSASTLTPRMMSALVDALLDLARLRDQPAFEVATSAAVWSVSQPPLSSGLTVFGRRIRRARLMLGELVESQLLNASTAQSIVNLVRGGRNLLIVATESCNGLAVLDALLALTSPGLLSVLIGDTRRFDTEIDVTFVDRAPLDTLTPAAAAAVRQLVRRARWCFCDRLATPADLDWWLGGDCFGRGRLGVLVAPSVQQGLERLQGLHRVLFGYSGKLDGLCDAVLFVEHLRAGRPNGVELIPLEGAAEAPAEPLRVAAATTLEAERRIAQVRDAVAELPERPIASPRENDFRAEARPRSSEFRAAEAERRPVFSSEPTGPRTSAFAAEPTGGRQSAFAAEPSGTRGNAFDARAALQEQVEPSPRPSQPAIPTVRVPEEPSPTPPRASQANLAAIRAPEPPRQPRSEPVLPPVAMDAPNSTIATDPSLLAEANLLRRRAARISGPQQPVASPPSDPARKRPLSASGLLKPRSSTSSAPADALTEVEADFSLDEPQHPADAAFSDFGRDLFGADEPAATSDGAAVEATPGPADMMFGPGELDEMMDGTDEGSRAEPQPRRSAGPSRYSMETARNDADNIRAQRSASRYTPEPQAPPAGAGTPPAGASGARWRPVVGRGAATPATARPATPAPVAPAEQNFMQEGTLDDAVEGTFADEPTRRAEWTDAKVTADIAARLKGIAKKP